MDNIISTINERLTECEEYIKQIEVTSITERKEWYVYYNHANSTLLLRDVGLSDFIIGTSTLNDSILEKLLLIFSIIGKPQSLKTNTQFQIHAAADQNINKTFNLTTIVNIPDLPMNINEMFNRTNLSFDNNGLIISNAVEKYNDTKRSDLKDMSPQHLFRCWKRRYVKK